MFHAMLITAIDLLWQIWQELPDEDANTLGECINMLIPYLPQEMQDRLAEAEAALGALPEKEQEKKFGEASSTQPSTTMVEDMAALAEQLRHEHDGEIRRCDERWS